MEILMAVHSFTDLYAEMVLICLPFIVVAMAVMYKVFQHLDG
ncbi:MAG: hypothetical protein Q7S34_01355 [bacterium]|nr:hypothetical protein [bacterium]